MVIALYEYNKCFVKKRSVLATIGSLACRQMTSKARVCDVNVTYAHKHECCIDATDLV